VSAVHADLTGRRALRGLADRSLEPASVRRLFEAASLAPSAANKQPWRFVAIEDKGLLSQLQQTFTEGNYWAKKAPLVVAAWTHVDYDIRNPDGRDFALFDLGQAVMAFQVQAQHEGLVTHPFAGFDMVQASKLLGLPEGAILPVLITVSHKGSVDHLSEKHRDQESAPRNRKALEDIVAFR
jgi:nitroreductase